MISGIGLLGRSLLYSSSRLVYLVSQEENSQHFAVDYHVSKNYREMSELVFAEQTIKVPYRLLIEDTESYLQAGLAGLGMIQIPEFDARPCLKSGQLQQIFTEMQVIEVPVNLLLTDRQYRPQYFQDLIEWLDSLLKSKLSDRHTSMKE